MAWAQGWPLGSLQCSCEAVIIQRLGCVRISTITNSNTRQMEMAVGKELGWVLAGVDLLSCTWSLHMLWTSYSTASAIQWKMCENRISIYHAFVLHHFPLHPASRDGLTQFHGGEIHSSTVYTSVS